MNDIRPDIWQLQMRFDIDGLIGALKHQDSAIRKRAAAALRAMGSADALPYLKTALDTEQDAETRAAIVATLAALEVDDTPAAPIPIEEPPVPAAPVQPSISETDQLLDQLRQGSAQQIAEAATRLAELREHRAVESLIIAFNNTSLPDAIRLTIAEAMLKLDSAPSEVALLGALRSERWRVRRNGAAILGQINATWAVKPLAKAMREDENEVVRKTAYAALRRINTAEAREAIGVTRPNKPQTSPRKTGSIAKPPTQQLNKEDGKSAEQSPQQKIQWPRRQSLNETQRGKTADLNPDRVDKAKDNLDATQPSKPRPPEA